MTIEISDNARAVIERRISPKDSEGNPLETADEIFHRVATFVSSADIEYGLDPLISEERFYDMMAGMEFLPNSPTLVNAGRSLGQLSACFVLPVEDHLEAIFESVKNAALIHKTGGGTGFSFSRLRPENTTVSQTSGVASGPVSFMQVFDKATEVIKQGGTRRGANMGILRVDHPDILKFIDMKSDNKTLQNFNISVAITNKFMEALFATGESEKVYELTHDGKSYGTLRADEVWKRIIQNAWLTGDPGLIFIDRINEGKANPVPILGPIESTNPCGEQPLYPYDSCNLGSINLSKFILDKDGKRGIDYPRLAQCIYDAVHFLDNVISVNRYPLPEIAQVSHDIRRIGLGVMGWANVLVALDIPYNSEDAISLAKDLSAFISDEADKASRALGTRRGAFPLIGQSIYEGDMLRNATRTTIAPTGTISIIADTSSGIEPLFGLAFVRSHFLDKDDPNKRFEMVDVNNHFFEALLNYYSEEDAQQIVRKVLAGAHVSEFLPDEEAAIFVTANDISPEYHVMMQAAWQKNTDNAVSKTINFPNDATLEDIESAYLLAWKLDCKGITVYRDGSKENQVLSFERKEEDIVEQIESNGYNAQEERVPYGAGLGLSGREKPQRNSGQLPKLEKTRESVTHEFSVDGFKGYITVGLYPDRTPGEVFIVGNKSGSTTRGYLDTIGRLISKLLRSGVDISDIADSLIGQRFAPSGLTGDPEIPVASSVVDYIGRWLRRCVLEQRDVPEYSKVPTGDICPDCDAPLFYGEGCLICQSCGYSKCG